MRQLRKLYPEGWVRYCPECREYMDQSDPQNDSSYKTVIIDDTSCEICTSKHIEEVNEAQDIMGRLGTPKETK